MRLLRLLKDIQGALLGEEVHGRAGDLFLVFDDTAEAFLKTSYFSPLEKGQERAILGRLFRPYRGEPLHGKSLFIFFGSAMGDSVVLLPVIRRLKELYPDSQIYVSVRPFERHFYYGVREIDGLPNRVLNLKELPKVDYVVDFSGMSGSRDFLEMGMQQYYCKRLYIDWHSLEPKHYKLPLRADAVKFIRSVIKDLRRSKKPLLLVCPKSPAWVRRLPFELLRKLPKALPDYRLLIAQPSSDQTYARRLAVYGYVDLSSHMVHLDYFKALVSFVDVVLSVDTGCFHIAGALEKPVIGIFNTFECSHRNYYPKALCYQISYRSPVCESPCKISFVPASKENPEGMCRTALLNPTVYKDAPPCMYSIRAEDIAKLVEEALLLT